MLSHTCFRRYVVDVPIVSGSCYEATRAGNLGVRRFFEGLPIVTRAIGNKVWAPPPSWVVKMKNLRFSILCGSAFFRCNKRRRLSR